jgi:hypothetical protein
MQKSDAGRAASIAAFFKIFAYPNAPHYETQATSPDAQSSQPYSLNQGTSVYK